MKDLKKLAFLDIGLDGTVIRFTNGLPEVKSAVRTLDQARYAFADNRAKGLGELYYMYRDVARSEDRQVLERLGLRFDITVILPGLVGNEFIKTVGHYHPFKPGTTYTYPEVYEVLSGEATYVLQRPGAVNGEVEDLVVYIAKAGDKVVIPPGYGHITINASDEPLVMANWVAADFSSIYARMREFRGGGYYLIGNCEPTWTVNPNYSKVPELRLMPTRDYPEFGLFRGRPMYRLIVDAPHKLKFLTHPEMCLWPDETQLEQLQIAQSQVAADSE